MLLAVGDSLFDPSDVEEHAPVGRAPSFLDFAYDAPGDMVAGEEFRRAACVLIACDIPPTLFGVIRRLSLVEFGDVVEHEPDAFAVLEDSPLAPDAFCNQKSLDGGRPDHACRVELHELHVDQFGACMVGQRVAVPGALPRVAGDGEGLSDPAGCDDDGLREEHHEVAMLPEVRERAADLPFRFQQRGGRAFHVELDSLVDAVVLERADHFEPGAVTDVGQPGVLVPSEVPLQDAAVGSTIEERAPSFQFKHSRRRFLGVVFGHEGVVEVLAAPHRVGKVDLPSVPVVDVADRCGDASLGHHRMGFSKQRLAHDAYADACGGGLDRGPQPRTASADDQHVVFMSRVIAHLRRTSNRTTPPSPPNECKGRQTSR
ncbi:MAG: hypothetical protein CNCCGFBP_01861 [Fimbriimonadaceae bacterium]|nr:hypothetical protein [Fimbriimonadaceae bacterium]